MSGGKKTLVSDEPNIRNPADSNFYFRGYILVTQQPISNDLSKKRSILYLNISRLGNDSISEQFEKFDDSVFSSIFDVDLAY